MSNFTAKIFTGSSITAVIDGKSFTVGTGHVNWSELLEAYRDNDADTFLELVDVVQTISNYAATSGGKVKVENETVYYNGEPLHSTLTTRMLDLLADGHDIQPLVNFLEDLMKNPSKNAVDELYTFIEKSNIGICEDGSFIAYKCVRNNYLDKYSGTIDNKPGTVVRMSRNKVTDNKELHCAYGLHVGALEYSGPNTGWYWSPGDVTLLVKVFPRHVVSVPTDHSFTKMRVEEYTVLDTFKGELNKSVYSGKGVNDEGYDPEEYEYDEEEEDLDTLWMDPTDLEEEDTISFLYKGEHRRVLVERIEDGLITGKLQYPEVCLNQYRSFSMDEMEEVELVN